MPRIQGSSSEKIQSPEKVTSLFADELRLHLFVLSLVSICTEVFLLLKGNETDLERGFFIMSVISFFLFFSALEYLFGFFIISSISSVFHILPALLLFALLKDNEAWPYLDIAVVVAAVLRVLFAFIRKKELVLLWGCFVLDIAALCLFFEWKAFSGKYYTDKLLFICLTVLTLSALQKLIYALREDAFPFYYFAIVGIIVLALPMGNKPIDWTPVVDAGVRIVQGVRNAADDVSYYLSFTFGEGSYVTGYSSLGVTGNSIKRTEKTQLILRTEDKPFHIYTDDDTDTNMKMRRTVYLQGGRGADKKQLVYFLKFLYERGADKEMAMLFSQLSHMDIEYAYLDTADEIAPVNSILLTDSKGEAISKGSTTKHKKGYSISARFIDIDYGSPYLIGLLRENVDTSVSDSFSYETASGYMKELYGIGLEKFLDRGEFEAILSEIEHSLSTTSKKGDLSNGEIAYKDLYPEYTDTDGASDRMKKLAAEITSGAKNDYDKCKAIEGYLRQYTYSTNAVGGHDPDSDMSTSEGIADIADRFLFETEQGYCVHYAASMIMLLRLSGIPARVCVGYRYAFPFDARKEYVVSSSCAHIWPEAFMKDAGWIPFEPTKAYSTATDHSWHRKAKVESETQVADSYNYEYPVELPAIPEVSVTIDSETEASVDAEEEKLAVRIFKVAWPVALSIVLLLIVLVLGTSAITWFRYKHGTPEKKLSMDVEVIKKLILKKAENEFTDRGLLSDYTDAAPDEVRADLEIVFNAYYRMIYGGSDAASVTAKENDLARMVREKLGSGTIIDR
ncbi:transglutaminase-like domain-containing protein [Butyrivibrio sp. WCD3002]|uniref:transglutaminase-like domain-containing protein n=1 Tax=Butyrivibrio sp. WCD3002 TaxID=1280676 RepID=UPI00047E8EC6|nr:transglutaminase-like domain-containing protein [Butyrivibrio sp. WCD3002]